MLDVNSLSQEKGSCSGHKCPANKENVMDVPLISVADSGIGSEASTSSRKTRKRRKRKGKGITF